METGRALMWSIISFSLSILTGGGFFLFMAIVFSFYGLVFMPILNSMDTEGPDDE